jgi:sRNA-binding protein
MQPEIFLCLLNRANADFPAAFAGKGKPIRPLALGTDRALFDAWPDLPRVTVRKFLACYCSRLAYLRALVEGGPRYRLDGGLESEVSAVQKEHAALRLAVLEQRTSRTRPDNSAASASSSPPRLACAAAKTGRAALALLMGDFDEHSLSGVIRNSKPGCAHV